ncbi:integrase [Mycobacterium paragordonae]|uniref:Integrase n=1 Tax=Mycobacterium paragordonae TaxID=1389713 RepID=A0AAJ1W7Y2_9MYCO|nr:integrase [Mycobacterium paragordonae]MDP7738709.1 integrase [Mycobacterium paragordonae]
MSNQSGGQLTNLLANDPYSQHVVARLRDFFGETTPWQRRLWDTGTVLALRELAEATDWCSKGVLSASAVTWLARDIEKLAGRDRGVGERDLRIQLRNTLQSNVPCGSRHHRRLVELTEFVNRDYLAGWARAADAATPASPERCSRAIASHLLDCGYSVRFLRQWVGRLSNSAATLADLFESAKELAAGIDRDFDAVIPFVSLPQYKQLAMPLSNWMSVKQMRNWLSPRAFPSGLRLHGGFRYTVQARDAFAAADLVVGIVDRLKARSSHGRGFSSAGLEAAGFVWVRDGDDTHEIRLKKEPRSAYVLSLEAEGKVYDVNSPTAVDDALELAAPLNYGPPGPAVSGGWAAIEALLTTPSDADDGREGRGAVAADRMAILVAASWPRGELTTLSYRHKPTAPDRLGAELHEVLINSERARLVAGALESGRRLTLGSPSDRAAESRMKALVDAPKDTLGDVNRHMRTAFRRLYRQRNILMHGGTTGSIALPTALRTAAPLIGAGLDRLTHAVLTEGISPLQLAARAQLNIDLLGGDDARHLVDLLEPQDSFYRHQIDSVYLRLRSNLRP